MDEKLTVREAKGVLASVGVVFLCHGSFAGMVLEGIPGFVLVTGVFLYGSVLILSEK